MERAAPLHALYATSRPPAIREFAYDCRSEELSLEIDKGTEIVVAQIEKEWHG